MKPGPKPKVKPEFRVIDCNWRPPRRPACLVGKPHGGKAWKVICQHVYDAGTWNEVYIGLIEMLCMEIESWHELNKAIRKYGDVVSDGRGGIKANPGFRMRKSAADLIIRIMSELGITPTASARANLANGKEYDAFDELVLRRNKISDGKR